jgi:hypothetical protein
METKHKLRQRKLQEPLQSRNRDIHGQSIENMTMFITKVIQAIQHDKLHVVVGLLKDKSDEARRSG